MWRKGPTPVLNGKEQGKERYDDWHLRLREQELVLYSDGSQDRQTGWGFVAYMNGKRLHQQHGSLKRAKVFDAEAIGAQKAAEWAENNKELIRPRHVHFCLDNTAVIRRLPGHPTENSQEAFLKFYEMQDKLRPSPSYIHWSSGHMGIDDSRGLSSQCEGKQKRPVAITTEAYQNLRLSKINILTDQVYSKGLYPI